LQDLKTKAGNHFENQLRVKKHLCIKGLSCLDKKGSISAWARRKRKPERERRQNGTRNPGRYSKKCGKIGTYLNTDRQKMGTITGPGAMDMDRPHRTQDHVAEGLSSMLKRIDETAKKQNTEHERAL